jgi:hypothetical protein
MAVGLRFPEPDFLGSALLRGSLPNRSGGMGPIRRMTRDSLPAVRPTTGGDTNPDGPRDVFLAH